MLRRKVDNFLIEWKKKADRRPLVVKGARQVGKTMSILHFAKRHYKNVVEINFVLQRQYQHIFEDGFEVDSIIKNITLLNPELTVVPGETLLFFDELQACPDCATSLKSFMLDGRYDVICSGSLMGVYYQQIESNSVGYKEDYQMYSMDFEEFLWARGYDNELIEELFAHMRDVRPLSSLMMRRLTELFREYMVVGGMPQVVNTFVSQGNYSGVLSLQRQLLTDYEEDITKYAIGFEKAKVLGVYRHISTFLAQENKRFQVTKIANNARNRQYIGAVEWLDNAGIINICYCLHELALPLKGNYNPKLYKIYFRDTGLLIASLDEEAQDDLRLNQNFATYKGAIYENMVADMLAKQGYGLYYYRNDKSSLEMDFFVRSANHLWPLEVKANNTATASLKKLTDQASRKTGGDISYGIKLCAANIGFNGQFYTFPYFLTFLLKRWLREQP
ncbi:MAG: ATP-binding protein [Muribaculaceae bacterium]|nr:ATP-binding protein [Muribaculaceae bacterium]